MGTRRLPTLRSGAVRFGTVAIVGRSNVGKSTFLNAVLGEPLAIVSPMPQTTRDALLGVAQVEGAQIAFRDTPGLHRPWSELGRRMNAAAVEAARSTDALLFMMDATELGKSRGRPRSAAARRKEDLDLLARLPRDRPCVVAINKVDALKDKTALLPAIAELTELRDLAAVVPMSALHSDGVDRVLRELVALLPEGPAAYDADTLTDRPTSFFVREYVREQVMLCTRGEVPHASAVSLDQYDERDSTVVIRATVHVEKPGQRAVLVGRGGERIKEIGTRARERIEALVDKKVHLELFVRLTPRWKSAARQLAELGYDTPPVDEPWPVQPTNRDEAADTDEGSRR